MDEDLAEETNWRREVARLRSLYALDLLGDATDRFESIARLAASSLDVPVALVTLMDTDNQWFSAAHGTDLDGNARNLSFCTHVIDGRLDVLAVEDTHLDPRFVDLPIVAGEPHIRFYAGMPICTASGEAIGTVCALDVVARSFGPDQARILADLVDVVERELRHVEIAATDALTGLANRRGFVATAEGFMSLAAARSEHISVIFGDVNGLKTVNDERGHDAGDVLLQRAAAAFGDAAGPTDLAARVGGDEFAVVSYALSDDEIEDLVACLGAAISARNAAADDGIELSISLGHARSRPDDSVEDVFKRADTEMYADKSRRASSRSSVGNSSRNLATG